jgi:hypothetical protein
VSRVFTDTTGESMTDFLPGDVVRYSSALMDKVNGPGTVRIVNQKTVRVIWNKNPNQWVFADLVEKTDLRLSPDDPKHPQWFGM